MRFSKNKMVFEVGLETSAMTASHIAVELMRLSCTKATLSLKI